MQAQPYGVISLFEARKFFLPVHAILAAVVVLVAGCANHLTKLPDELDGDLHSGMEIGEVQSILKSRNVTFWEPYPSTPYGTNPRTVGSGQEILARTTAARTSGCWTGTELVFQFDKNDRLEKIISSEVGGCE